MINKQLKYIDIEKSLGHDKMFERDIGGNLIPAMDPDERCVLLVEAS